MRGLSAVAFAVVSLVTTAPTVALAGADPGYVPTEAEIHAGAGDEREQGWDFSLTLGASFSVGSNSNVIGQTDGTSVSFGMLLDARAELLDGPHDFRNMLKINEVFTRTPVVDEFIKSVDELLLESVYYFSITDTFGPFASFKLRTAILDGEDVRPGPVTYVDAADATVVLAADVDSLELTAPFQPLILKEAVGFFWRPVSQKKIDLSLRAGFGAMQVFADGALAVTDDDATPQIEVARLEDASQAGAVIAAEAVGELAEGEVTYTARAEVMFPFINDDPQDRGAGELANYDLSVTLAFKMFEWMSLDYQFKAIRQPQLLDEWQIQNALLLTFSYTVE